MQIENTFTVGASPDTVFAFLLDVNRIVACVPGAELSEVVDPDTFRGKVRIKVGPVTVSYNGTAHITSRDEQARSATLQAEGRETTGSGSARATTTMTVTPEGPGSSVRFATDFTVVGRVAQFGRGIMEEVSRKLVGQMAECIRAKLEAEGGSPAAAAAGASEVPATPPSSNGGGPKDEAAGSPRPRASTRRSRAGAKPAAAEQSISLTGTPAMGEMGAAGEGAAPATGGVSAPAPGSAPVEPEPDPAPAPAPAAPAPAPVAAPPARVQIAREPDEVAAAPVDAIALARSIAADRLRAVGPGRLVGVAAGLFALFALVRILRRKR